MFERPSTAHRCAGLAGRMRGWRGRATGGSMRGTPPRPSSAPLSRILSRSPSSRKPIPINYKRRNYVTNALTQVHEGLTVSSARPKIKSYLSLRKSRPRRPCRNMAIQLPVDWSRLLKDAKGNEAMFPEEVGTSSNELTKATALNW